MDIVDRLRDEMDAHPLDRTDATISLAIYEITTLRNQLAECKKDAERYNFIRTDLSYHIANALHWDCVPHISDKPPFDYLIDQAMSEKG
jgi:hypothetical protein